MKSKGRIVVVDDDQEMGRLVKDVLTAEGYEIQQLTSAADALIRFKTEVPQVVITDLKMKDIDGMMFLRKMQSDYPSIVTLMMTAFGSIETAVEALKSGAYHYIIKPFKNDELVLLVDRAMERAKLTSENKTLKSQLSRSFSLDSIIGKSPAMLQVFETVRRVAPAAANVLISGESGTGKELIARAIHNIGARKDKPFVPVNCSAIPEHLLESELFGHIKGSFTGAISDKKGLFEVASGGTIFLDEIGDLDLTLQAKLLRVLQDKQIRAVGDSKIRDIDVRVIAATHRDLGTMVKNGTFREDLFYRLNVIPIRVPSVRERTEDIPLLVDTFVRKFSSQNNSSVQGVSPKAMAVLLAHPWPGNVRELENVIERAVVLNTTEMIDEKDILGSAIQEAKQSVEQLYSDRPTLPELEERYIRLIMNQTNHSKEEAAKILGISRRTLYRKEREYGMVPQDDYSELEQSDA